MLFANIIEKISFAITLIIPIIIYIITLIFNKMPILNKENSKVFFIPGFVLLYLFFFSNLSSFKDVILVCEMEVCILILFLSSTKYNSDLNVLSNLVIYSSSIVIIYSYIMKIRLPKIITSDVTLSIVFLVIMFIAIFIYVRKKSNSLLLLGLILIAVSNIAVLLINIEYVEFVGLIIRTISYIVFLMYFRRLVYDSIMGRISEANKLKKSVEKQLNYEVKKRTIEIEKSNERLIELANQDSLTKAYNKKAILSIIEKEIISKEHRQISLLMFDIDKFKYINDKYGHIKGDICIKTLSGIAQESIRDKDYLGRYGGDEFVIVLPSLSLSEASVVAERLRLRVSTTENPTMTISIGVATYPQDGRTVEALISAADKGLYISKNKGRNTVSHHKFF